MVNYGTSMEYEDAITQTKRNAYMLTTLDVSIYYCVKIQLQKNTH